jgi:replicative DNA helicase
MTHDIDAESALLAMLFCDNRNFVDLDNLSPDDFHSPDNAAIYAAALDMQAEGNPVNVVTLKAFLTGLRLDDGRTGLELLQQFSFAGEHPKVRDLVDRIRDLALRRRAAELSQSLALQFTDEQVARHETALYGIRKFDEILVQSRAHLRSVDDWHTWADDAIIELQSDRKAIEITTGFRDLDEALRGYHRGQVAVVCGRTSMGKTALALASGALSAFADNSVLMFSLEMSANEVVKRLLSMIVWTADQQIPFSRMHAGQLSQDELERIARAQHKMAGKDFRIDQQVGLTVADIKARTRRRIDELEKAGKTLDLVIIDHIGKIAPSGRYKGNRTYEIGEASQGFVEMARQLNVPVIALAQLNRQNEQRPNKRGALSDIRDSGNIEQDADVVMIAYREAYYLERLRFDEGSLEEVQRLADLDACKNRFELQIAKNRNGPCTDIKFFCDMGSNVICNAAKEHQENRYEQVSRGGEPIYSARMEGFSSGCRH